MTGIKSIQIGKGAQITSDAIILAVENEIEIVFMDKGGNPLGRVQKILGLTTNKERTPADMLFFVMYDIENDKVRNQVAKYLLAKGCTRIQNSVFLADLSTEVYEQIRKDLTEVQACYDNEDSILIVPLSTDHIKAMRVIGKTIDTDIVMHNKNTLFF